MYTPYAGAALKCRKVSFLANMLAIKNLSMLMTSVSENFLVESEWLVVVVFLLFFVVFFFFVFFFF
jgi:hypothetical protein